MEEGGIRQVMIEKRRGGKLGKVEEEKRSFSFLSPVLTMQ
jgi:hypothetical protein